MSDQINFFQWIIPRKFDGSFKTVLFSLSFLESSSNFPLIIFAIKVI